MSTTTIATAVVGAVLAVVTTFGVVTSLNDSQRPVDSQTSDVVPYGDTTATP